MVCLLLKEIHSCIILDEEKVMTASPTALLVKQETTTAVNDFFGEFVKSVPANKGNSSLPQSICDCQIIKDIFFLTTIALNHPCKYLIHFHLKEV